MKKRLFTVLIVIIFLSGLSLLLYPTVSDYLNSVSRAKDISTYAVSVSRIDEAEREKIWNSAVEYNTRLAQKPTHWRLSKEEIADYDSQLDVAGMGIMAYVEIPKQGCTLPVYHGTGAEVLQIAVGHLEGSSLPVGGKSTHCVLSGHRGLPSAKLFSNLDQMAEGDTFSVRTLDKVLTYEVDEICTPYGVNTHRLLVRGHRVDEANAAVKVTADALQIDPLLVAPAIAVPLILILFIIVILHRNLSGRRKS